ncbi:MAG: glycine/betaine transporter ATP-binding protein [Hymenobacter sp.]|jgi:osmoprotectant transport system ATP-binding protein|nr:glycine/betaine transporter ATP-binding protein [Hymenobacter sp.]
MPDAQPPVIRASQLSKRFGAHAVVQDVCFELAAGETLVLLGPSGCGKTTLLKMLNRLIEPDGGTVEINGQNVLDQRPEELRRGMGYVIQQVGLLPHYTVAENVAVVPRLLGHAAAAVQARTTELLARLYLPPERYAGQYPHQLSGGQQQPAPWPPTHPSCCSTSLSEPSTRSPGPASGASSGNWKSCAAKRWCS